jgi:hypothetical protein
VLLVGRRLNAICSPLRDTGRSEALVNGAGAPSAVNPADEEILTLEEGNIDIFADQSALVIQRRITTELAGSS